MTTENNDDDFEDIFSFGASAPSTANDPDDPFNLPSKAPATTNPTPNAVTNESTHSSHSDFAILNNDDDDDIFGDAFLSSTGGGVGKDTSATSITLGNDVLAPLPNSSTLITPRDEFDHIFGTPPATPSTPSTPLVEGEGRNLSQRGKESLAAIGANPLGIGLDEKEPHQTPNRATDRADTGKHLTPNQNRDRLSSDDFHPHDAGTRDFLEWLDDDTATKKAGGGDGAANVSKAGHGTDGSSGAGGAVPSSGVGVDSLANADTSMDDDFDFDQMLAEASQSDVVEPLQPQPPKLTGDAIATAIQSRTSVSSTSGVTDPNMTMTPLSDTSNLVELSLITPTTPMDAPSVSSADLQSKNKLADLSLPLSTPTEGGESAGVVADSATSGDFLSDSQGSNVTPLPLPNKKSTIEEELSFDQWEESEEVVDGPPGQSSSSVSEVNVPSATTMSALAQKNIADGITSDQSSQITTLATSSPVKAVHFSSFSEAIRSNASTMDDIRSLLLRDSREGREKGMVNTEISDEDRPYLWTKVICGKVLTDLEKGSLADSFRDWMENRKKKLEDEAEEGTSGIVHSKYQYLENDPRIDALLQQAGNMRVEDAEYLKMKQNLISLLEFHGRNNSSVLSPLAATTPASPKSNDTDESVQQNAQIDPLIPPVALAILSAQIPPAAASVVLSSIEPFSMPLLRLSQNERFGAAKALHSDFYLLACYHLPLLVMHLDRHCGGWYWPRQEKIENGDGKGDVEDEKSNNGGPTEPVDSDRAREKDAKEGNEQEKMEETNQPSRGQPTERRSSRTNDDQNGLIPISYFVTNFAGSFNESTSTNSCLRHTHLLPLWDNLLTRDCSWKYFLAISLLEKHSDALLMARGDELKGELVKILSFEKTSFDEESFVGGDNYAEDKSELTTLEWLQLAMSLMESTPTSVIERLKTADDRSLTSALQLRQSLEEKRRVAEEKARTDSKRAEEAKKKKEREEREIEERKALHKAKLIQYYREKNLPEKIEKVDEILKLFEGRINVLNEKLKNKYGEGFLPDEPLKEQTRSFFLSVNQSINDTKRHVALSVAERRKRNESSKSTTTITVRPYTHVALEVSPAEVLPVVCSTKGICPKTGQKFGSQDGSSNIALTSPVTSTHRGTASNASLKFYLIDCRPTSIAKEQGRFPTAVDMSPQTLQDPDALQDLIDMFESLRGAVHICVMGEGFSAFPILYDHQLTSLEEKLLEDDISRTSSCALFFLKKGFPFVSILKGGFAAAHAYLSRNGPSLGMEPSEVLIDYDPVVSLFAQLEHARQEQEDYKNAPAREKTARTLQKIIDHSMVRLTLEEQRINDLAADLTKQETVDKVKQSVSNILSKVSHRRHGAPKEAPPPPPPPPKDPSPILMGRTPPLFMMKQFSSSSRDNQGEEKSISEKGSMMSDVSLDVVEGDVSPPLEGDGSNQDATITSKGKSAGTSGSSKAEATSSVSNVFSSIAQRIHHQTNKPVAGVSGDTIEDTKKESDGQGTDTSNESLNREQQGNNPKRAFSSFASRFASVTHQPAITKTSSPKNIEDISKSSEKEDNKETTDSNEASKPANSSSKNAFSSFASRFATPASSAEVASLPKNEETDGTSKADDKENAEAKDSTTESTKTLHHKSAFSSFASRFAAAPTASIKTTLPEQNENVHATSDKDATQNANSPTKTTSESAENEVVQEEPHPSSVSKISFSGFANRFARKPQVASEPSSLKSTSSTQDEPTDNQGQMPPPARNPFATLTFKNPATKVQISDQNNAVKSNEASSDADDKILESDDGEKTTTSKNPFALRNPFSSLIQSQSTDSAENKVSSEISAPAIVERALSFGEKLREYDDPFAPESMGFAKSRFAQDNKGDEQNTTSKAKTEESKSNAFSPSEESILFHTDDNEDEIEFLNMETEDQVLDAQVNEILKEEGELPKDLFQGLVPLPQGDPMKDLFGDNAPIADEESVTHTEEGGHI